jgi:hypothetical protein
MAKHGKVLGDKVPINCKRISKKALKGEVMKVRKVFVSLGLVALLSCASFAQKVKTDYDRKVDFTKYKTYSWEAVKTKNQLDIDRIKSAVDADLTAKGWTAVPTGGSISLCAVEATKDQQTLSTFYNGFGGGWRWRSGFANGNTTTYVDNYKVGTLVLDMFDSQTKELVWRSSASNTLSDNADKNIKNLNKGVEKMLKKFPPSAKK